MAQGKNLFKKSHHSVFDQIFLFFVLLVLLCIISIGYFSYLKSSSLLETEVENSTVSSLNQVRELVDSKFRSFNGLTEHIFLETNVSTVYYKSGKSRVDSYLFKNIIGYLDSIKTTDAYFDEIWIYFNNVKIFVTSTTVHRQDIFYSSIINSNDFLLDKIMNNEDGDLQYCGKYDINLINGTKEVLSFVKAVNYDSVNARATITYNINPVAIHNMIENLKNEYNHDVFILDEVGNIILSSKNEQSDVDKQYNQDEMLAEIPEYHSNRTGIVEHNDYTIAYTYSDITNWTYVSIQPQNSIREKSLIIKQFTFTTSIAVLLIALIFSYLLTKKIYSPIKSIISYINNLPNNNLDKNKNMYEFAIIRRIINYVYKENVDLKKIMQRNAQEKLLDRFISGDIDYEKFIESKEANVSFQYKNYVVLIYELSKTLDNFKYKKLNEIPPIDFENELIKVSGNEIFAESKVYTYKKGSKYIAIINFEDKPDQEQDLAGYIEATNLHLKEYLSQTITTGVGKTYNSPDKLKDSFKEAVFALKYKLVKGLGSIIYVDEAYAFPRKLLDYSLDVETRLVNLTKSAEVDKTKKILENIINSNINTEHMDVYVMDTLFNSLVGTAIRIIFDIQCSVEEIMGEPCILYNEMVKKETFGEKKEYIIEDIYMSIIRYIKSHRKNKLEKVYNQAVKYIENNYYNDLSLETIGEETGVSISYLSVIFKEISGVKFVDYVNKFRISKAKELLKDSSLTINDITERVGYLNTNTFINVFKKHEGITPGKYRTRI